MKRSYHYTSLQLVEVVWRSRRSILVSYRAMDGYPEPRLSPGHFALFAVPGVEAIPLAPIQRGSRLFFLVVRRGPTSGLIVESPPARAGLIWPLGSPVKQLHGYERVVLVAGGTGVASLIPVASMYASSGVRVELYYGARTGEELAPIDLLVPASVEVVWVTEDGSRGVKGTVVEAAAGSIRSGDLVYAAGPPGMLCSLAEKLETLQAVRAFFSLETIVRCGLGFCGRCSVACTGKLLCREGPFFPLGELGCWLRRECSGYAAN